MANVIREDVISIGFDFDNSGLLESQKMLENFKKSLGIDTSEIDEANESFNETAESCKKLKDSVSNFKKEVSGGINTSGIDNIKKSAEQTKETVDGSGNSIKKVAQNFIDVKKAAESMKKEGEEGFKKIKKAVENLTFDKIKSAFASVGSKIKSVANNLTSASDTITSKLFNVKSLVAGIATGATVQKSIDIVVDRQNITSQFEVLLGVRKKPVSV